ncbi:hypothetical protein Peur_013084 [Populus x canadensis]
MLVILAEGGSIGGEESGNKLNVWLLSGLEDNITTLWGCASQMLGGCQPAWLDLRDDGPAMDSKWKKYFSMAHMTDTRKKKVDDILKVFFYLKIY